MRKIKLTQGKYAIVDDEDYEYLNQWRWFTFKNGYVWYVARETTIDHKRKCIYMHRLIMNAVNGECVDHINRNGLDNRKYNLR